MDVAPSAIPENVQPQEQHGGSSPGDGESYGLPRLVIREMVLENFKSYAGAQKVGPFHKVSLVEVISSASFSSFNAHIFSWRRVSLLLWVPMGLVNRM